MQTACTRYPGRVSLASWLSLTLTDSVDGSRSSPVLLGSIRPPSRGNRPLPTRVIAEEGPDGTKSLVGRAVVKPHKKRRAADMGSSELVAEAKRSHPHAALTGVARLIGTRQL